MSSFPYCRAPFNYLKSASTISHTDNCHNLNKLPVTTLIEIIIYSSAVNNVYIYNDYMNIICLSS